MNSLPIAALGAVALFVVGCATSQSNQHAASPQVKPSLILSPPTVPSGASTVLDEVVAAPVVTSYTVGRTIDPADPSVLHEAHVVYRRETDAAWRLQVRSSRDVSVAPAGKGASLPGPDPVRLQEVDTVLAELRRASEENRQAIALLFQALENLTRVKAGSPTAAPGAPSSPAVSPSQTSSPTQPSPPGARMEKE